ncbi:MAG: class I SAM-dependent methyltransferase [Usitatibacter sp.]
MDSNDEAQALVEQAKALEASAPGRAMELYAAAFARSPRNLEAHNALERLGAPERYGRWMLLDCTIDPRDEIYRFFATHPIAMNPVREYLADGWRTLAELMLVLESVGRPLTRVASFLEFACGFGRFTRHIARVLPGKVTAADVQPGSVEFVRDHFGVAGFHSALDPAAMRIPGRYDVVFVLSMFTHLPPGRWQPWLKALFAAVAPGGVLVFTVHNEQHGRELGVAYGSDGTRFIASSESSALDADAYGTTFTTREFVEREVAKALPGRTLHYREIAFWAGQDAVVVEG